MDCVLVNDMELADELDQALETDKEIQEMMKQRREEVIMRESESSRPASRADQQQYKVDKPTAGACVPYKQRCSVEWK